MYVGYSPPPQKKKKKKFARYDIWKFSNVNGIVFTFGPTILTRYWSDLLEEIVGYFTSQRSWRSGIWTLDLKLNDK